MTKFHEHMSRLIKEISEELVQLLMGREDELTEVAGTLKYIGVDMKFLKVCAETAATTEGRPQLVGLECMAFVKAHHEALVSIRDALKHGIQ
ncbi:hypothetical protein A3C18_02640 [Candidatus Kaiserbacteria bacterium RIFCSPHIGHO2_02_FULL_54_11b]|uniref:Uncharacterized protein n=2 Tax=Candidatus Kaiseribacteriota TaxID=1752734 RepID=A0A1F6CK24_9BACT|nr:MAG: hypothetical protein A2704_07130 [Candidatus Kaiserbacteria bacterium RIFCSPHIGHO2_01_FULL_54_36b]OGG64376.1 MAG: hypothetical protein A3C18_02640 [Candidatus Kaiserbacteria bacterium RIFCSPHIGHO2_02_FULL_54_11b]